MFECHRFNVSDVDKAPQWPKIIQPLLYLIQNKIVELLCPATTMTRELCEMRYLSRTRGTLVEATGRQHCGIRGMRDLKKSKGRNPVCEREAREEKEEG